MLSTDLYIIIPPLFIATLPWLVSVRLFKFRVAINNAYLWHARYLLTAALLWVVGFFIPRVPQLSNQTDSFTLHFTGGVVAAVLFIYFLRVSNIKLLNTWWKQIIALYFFVSGLGVANELLEFMLSETSIMPGATPPTLYDTWWDLVANTLGAFVVYVVAKLLVAWRGNKYDGY